MLIKEIDPKDSEELCQIKIELTLMESEMIFNQLVNNLSRFYHHSIAFRFGNDLMNCINQIKKEGN